MSASDFRRRLERLSDQDRRSRVFGHHPDDLVVGLLALAGEVVSALEETEKRVAGAAQHLALVVKGTPAQVKDTLGRLAREEGEPH